VTRRLGRFPHSSSFVCQGRQCGAPESPLSVIALLDRFPGASLGRCIDRFEKYRPMPIASSKAGGLIGNCQRRF
jgi:hypothetical protein